MVGTPHEAYVRALARHVAFNLGVLLKPLGYHLFAHTNRDLKVDWRDALIETEGPEEHQLDREQQAGGPLAEKLQDVLVKGLELADKLVVSKSNGELSVRLQNTPYIGTCHSVEEEAPQVCEQIGCPLCSLIACIYTEHADVTTFIKEARSDERDITITGAEQPQYGRSPVDDGVTHAT